MTRLNVSTPSGFPELTPSQERVKQHWIDTIRFVFESYGFFPITTPLVEREENFLAKGGNAKEIYVLKRLLDEDDDTSHSGNALRFDHTVPLALYIARHLNDIKFPFRRYVIGPVLRGERAQKGRFRQFDQCDIDIVGSEHLSLANDALLPALIIDIFNRLNIGDFVVRINNRKLLQSFFRTLNVSDENMKPCFDILDDLEKKGEKFVRSALETLGVSVLSIENLFSFLALQNADPFQMFESIEKQFGALSGLDELREVFQILQDLGVPQNRYRFDVSIARGLDYYTGTVYETTLLSSPELGSICSGGRYDDLASLFTGKSFPGVGISIGVTRLLSQLFSLGVLNTDRSTPSEAVFLRHDFENKDHQKYVFDLARELRSKGVSVETYLEPKKMKKQFDYADSLGIPFCIIVGEDEFETQSVLIKNMKTGDQSLVPRTDLVLFFQKQA